MDPDVTEALIIYTLYVVPGIVYLVGAWFTWNLLWIDVPRSYQYPLSERMKWLPITILWPLVLIAVIFYNVLGAVVEKITR